MKTLHHRVRSLEDRAPRPPDDGAYIVDISGASGAPPRYWGIREGSCQEPPSGPGHVPKMLLKRNFVDFRRALPINKGLILGFCASEVPTQVKTGTRNVMHLYRQRA